jgi:4-hydroxy-tetrahydrodipicolinate reductase
MLSVCFAGITGWAAPPIVATIDAADDLTLTSGVSRSAAGQTLTAATASKASRSDGFVYATVSEALQSSEVDVLVDYTSASTVKDNVWTAVRAGVHVVIGSSGLTSSDYEELDCLARDHGVGVVAAGNFSIMAAVLLRAAAMAAQHVDQWEIIDYSSANNPMCPVAPPANSPRLWVGSAHPRPRYRFRTCTDRSRHEVLRWPAPGSIRCACPASWSARRSSSADPASG